MMYYLDAIHCLENVLGKASPGPRPGEVSFTRDAGDHKPTTVIPEDQVVEIAAISLRARTRNLLLQKCSGCTNCICH